MRADAGEPGRARGGEQGAGDQRGAGRAGGGDTGRDRGARDQAVHAYRAIWYYTAGEILVRATASRRRTTDARATYRDRVFIDLDPAELPHLSQVADRWAGLTAEDTYELGLRALLNGFSATH
ncbi:hypothetical protein Srubr_76980 [Streptomyces rubradiris]|uniref:Tetracycline repressor TetR C-terminal domain-containing protein n=1 Tax=Streptomyces rubradiris TaxID=285531 RepID=A0ABQ3RPS3_STRRR|nr:hypothetical protein GCM10018792_49530 [Streptomyces rubradiris]GHI57852.1 hypothetical protein Srubr_76980 [Streptomyces rubradiris]